MPGTFFIMSWNKTMMQAYVMSIYFYLIFLSLNLFAGHFENFDKAQLNDFKGRLTAIPEYYPSQGVVFSTPAFILTQSPEHPFVDELENLYRQIVTKSSNLKTYFFSTKNKSGQFPWRQRLFDISDSIQFIAPHISSADEFSFWPRDAAPISLRDSRDGTVILADTNYSQGRPNDDFIPSQLEQQANYNRISVPIYLDGGNFMVDSKAVCLVTEDLWQMDEDNKKSFDKNWITSHMKNYLGCKKIIALKALDYELTRHIDVFAKLLGDGVVAISDYKSNQLYLEDIITESFSCDANSIVTNNWKNCKPTKRTSLQKRAWNSLEISPIKDQYGKFREFSWDEIHQSILHYMPGLQNIDFTSMKKPSFRELSMSWKQQLQKHGYRVELLPVPPPQVTAYIELYKNSEQQTVFQYVRFTFTHRNYANSLLLNGKAFVPQYNITSPQDMNSLAYKVYQRNGYTVVPIASEYLVRTAGSVHCKTHQIAK